MGKSINYFELRDADVVVRPELNAIGSSDFASRQKSIEAGRTAMARLLPLLRAAISTKTR
jgi:NTE family protein